MRRVRILHGSQSKLVSDNGDGFKVITPGSRARKYLGVRLASPDILCPVSSIGRIHDYGSYDRGSTPLRGTAQVLISPIVELGVLIRLVNVKRLYALIV